MMDALKIHKYVGQVDAVLQYVRMDCLWTVEKEVSDSEGVTNLVPFCWRTASFSNLLDVVKILYLE